MKLGNSQSIREKLLQLSRSENLNFQTLITRYFHERLLYRISVSKYSTNFCLKGGSLLYALKGLRVRPTVDIDMLATNINNDKYVIKQIFTSICGLRYEDDCVLFDTDSIITEDIREEDKYHGIRVFVNSTFDTARQRLQIDLGFSDIVVPKPVTIEFPALLSELPQPHITAYSTETVIAEKFHAMITLGNLNSRMKDFYDIYTLLNGDNNVHINVLKDAIQATFNNRMTDFPQNAALFAPDFLNDNNRNAMWDSFLRKNKLEKIDFPHVVKFITDYFRPLTTDLLR